MTDIIPRVVAQCVHCDEQGIYSAEWVDAENATSIEIADLHVHEPHHFTDLCDDFMIVDQEGMFDEVINMNLEEIEEWAIAIQKADSDAPFSADVYLELCKDMNVTSPIEYKKLMEAYQGRYETFADFARECFAEMHENAIPNFLYKHIDWESVAREFEKGGFLHYTECGKPYQVYVFNSMIL